MVVRIRLSRLGCRNNPFYRVIVTDSKTTRDGKNLEVLGFYNPRSGKDSDKRMGLTVERVKYWLSVGAQPSDTVESLLFQAGLLPPPPIVTMGHQGGPWDKFPVDALNGHTLNQEQPANSDHKEDDGISPEAIFAIGLQVK
ncbi:small ribosomal subunit protein bS16cy-like [Gastrolobium bilobum]|uniref:small ribosomal subunit protein bS16cy-like n=1 Tax=Gastrolobium bilobum TaxID=150636 RepID=UPI002AB315E2|nr:small ribosomal subunit protein bS16cy-like [Gastrolobium bilobum]XP_061364989.1 small ribosomal subunit protein bS16cy-like [Gastrolobium bilobum]